MTTMTMDLAPAPAPAPAGPAPAHQLRDVFQRSAALIAERGWCRGAELHYVGNSHDPEAASLGGALQWAATGHAELPDQVSRQALSLLRDRIDPDRKAPFDDWELFCAWNDSPSRTRAQTIALLISARNAVERSGSSANLTYPRPLPGHLVQVPIARRI
ncbi:hypothetical protein [Streptomyces sp. NBC_01190]|uniref:DUF6197 family protein n=1 Tax=Streptomyces sp. NBC_01190 TaxID=2903767 RepID=UPI0038638278|nr:hypothetical protein OG519_31115 [Streptomyces sp. NBC_01190]